MRVTCIKCQGRRRVKSKQGLAMVVYPICDGKGSVNRWMPVMSATLCGFSVRMLNIITDTQLKVVDLCFGRSV